MDEAPASTMFNWGCAASHHLCIAEGTGKCVMELVTAAIAAGNLPICPVCSMENVGDEPTPPMERSKLRSLCGPQSEEWAAYKAIEMRGFIERGIGADAGGQQVQRCLPVCLRCYAVPPVPAPASCSCSVPLHLNCVAGPLHVPAGRPGCLPGDRLHKLSHER